LRSPLEDKEVTIARAKDTFTYPANFMLVCAMNPCPCGYLGDTKRECTCTHDRILKYRSRISGPILDRIDIHIEVPRIKHHELKKKSSEETSASIRERIERVRAMQRERYKELGFYTNADIPPKLIETFCTLGKEADDLLDMAVKELHLSARAYHRILKLGRTIADMSGSEGIGFEHISEAVQYRTLDRGA
jgi:magnesium chelatase family protein